MKQKFTEAEMATIRRYKQLAGDPTPSGGYATIRKGLVNKYVCRCCGKEVPFSEVASELNKLTGYCRECMRKCDEKQLVLDGDPDAIRRAEERDSAVQAILKAAQEGRLAEILEGDEDEDIDEDIAEDDDEDDF